jgi:putative transcriptional regulator
LNIRILRGHRKRAASNNEVYVPCVERILRRLSGRAIYADMAALDPKAIRTKLGLSQAEFARRFQLPYRTVQGWEIGRIPTSGTATVLLTLISREPETVARILSASKEASAGKSNRNRRGGD